MVRRGPMKQDLTVDRGADGRRRRSAVVAAAATRRPWSGLVRRPGDAILFCRRRWCCSSYWSCAPARSPSSARTSSNWCTASPPVSDGIFTFLYGFGSLWVVARARRSRAAAPQRAARRSASGSVASGHGYWPSLLVAWIDTERRRAARRPRRHRRDVVVPARARRRRRGAGDGRHAVRHPASAHHRLDRRQPRRDGGLYLAEGLPSDAVGGAVVGFAARTDRAPGHRRAGRATDRAVRSATRSALLHIEVAEVVEADSQHTGAVEMMAITTDGRHLVARVLGRDQRDASLLAKTWRWLTQKDFQPNLFVSRVNEVEHEAYVTLLAERAGAGVPDVVAAGAAGPDAAMLVEAYPPGRPLHLLAPGDLTPGAARRGLADRRPPPGGRHRPRPAQRRPLHRAIHRRCLPHRLLGRHHWRPARSPHRETWPSYWRRPASSWGSTPRSPPP